MTPAGVRELKTAGHQILVQSGAGAEIGLTDELYQAAGAVVMDTAEEVFNDADMIIKVKEPQPQSVGSSNHSRSCSPTFTWPPTQIRQRLAGFGRNVHCLRDSHVSKRWLTVAGPNESCGGRLSVQAGAHHMEIHQGGGGHWAVYRRSAGKGVSARRGRSGSSAIRVALGMGADVTVVDRSVERLGELDEQYPGQLRTVYSLPKPSSDTRTTPT